MNFMNSIKPSNFTETKIYVKTDLHLGCKYCTFLLSKAWYLLLKMALSVFSNYELLITKCKIKVKTNTETIHLILLSLFTSLLI